MGDGVVGGTILCEGDSDGGSNGLDDAGTGASITGAVPAGGGLELVVVVISAISSR
jgi:hypothetical protein